MRRDFFHIISYNLDFNDTLKKKSIPKIKLFKYYKNNFYLNFDRKLI